MLLNKKDITLVVDKLYNEYSDAICGLNYTNEYELTLALILAAQCTDSMVNRIIPILFNRYKTIENIANSDIEELKAIVKPCGFYMTKAKNIQLTCAKIVKDFNGKVPNSMNELTSLYGIGRKSSNIILQECFNITEGIAVDTHVSRVSYRLGITKTNIPLKQEQELLKVINKKYWNKINHIFVYHGRKICDAKKPKCSECLVNDICKKNVIKTKI